jgi:hypothetical protein
VHLRLYFAGAIGMVPFAPPIMSIIFIIFVIIGSQA